MFHTATRQVCIRIKSTYPSYPRLLNETQGTSGAPAQGPLLGPAPGSSTSTPGGNGSGTLGPVLGPSKPAPKPAVSQDLIRMKPTHLRVHRPGSTRPAGGASGVGGGSGKAGGTGAGRAAASSSFSVPRPAGGAFLTPRGARPGGR